MPFEVHIPIAYRIHNALAYSAKWKASIRLTWANQVFGANWIDTEEQLCAEMHMNGVIWRTPNLRNSGDVYARYIELFPNANVSYKYRLDNEFGGFLHAENITEELNRMIVSHDVVHDVFHDDFRVTRKIDYYSIREGRGEGLPTLWLEQSDDLLL